jgi:coenzyme F420 hydrogenase subunit beta
MNIKGKILVTTKYGIETISLADAKKHVRKNCRFCEDFSSEFADISAGGLGLDRWTFAIVRTGIGEELFSEALKAGSIRTKEPNEGALGLLCKLSERKARNFDIQDRH